MKTIAFLITPLLMASTLNGPAIIYKTDQAKSTLSIEGTSTLHDWEMTVEGFNGTIDVEVASNDIEIKSLKLNVPVKNLKSGKSPMDANAYKALKADAHKNINFNLLRVKSVTPSTLGYLDVLAEGNLTIAGVTKTLTIPIKAYTKEGGITLKGETSFNMSQFDVEPPTFMFGSVTTGDKVTIKFNINYN